MHKSTEAAESTDIGDGASRRFAFCAWGVAALSLMGTAAVLVQAILRFKGPLRTDFGVFYSAGRLGASGHPLQVYSTSHLNHLENVLGGHALQLFYPYPPYVTLLLSALARLPVSTAFVVWTAVNLAAYGCAGLLVMRRLGGVIGQRAGSTRRTLRNTPLMGLACLAGCIPVVVSLAQGENGGIVALGTTLVLLAAMKAPTPRRVQAIARPQRSPSIPRRVLGAAKLAAVTRVDTQIGMLAGGTTLLALKPQFLVVPLIVILASRSVWRLASVAGTIAFLLCAGLLEGGIHAYADFVATLKAGLTAGAKYHWGPTFNYTLQSQLQTFLGRNLVATALWLLLAVAILAVVYALWRVEQKRTAFPSKTAGTAPPAPRILSLSLENHPGQWLMLPAAAAAILASTHAMYHDLPLLYPAVVLALPFSRHRWAAIGILAAALLDPMVYPATHVHVVVLSLCAVLLCCVPEAIRYLGRRMDGYRLGVYRTGTWKSFAPPRWGSASGSETP